MDNACFLQGRKDTQKKEDTIRVLDLKRRAKKVFHIFLRLIILLAMSTEILDRFFTQTKGIFIRHFYHRRPP